MQIRDFNVLSGEEVTLLWTVIKAAYSVVPFCADAVTAPRAGRVISLDGKSFQTDGEILPLTVPPIQHYGSSASSGAIGVESGRT